MPFILLGILLAIVLLTPRVALGFVGGIPTPLTVDSIGDFGCVLRQDAAASWNLMKTDAAQDGCTLKPKGSRSAFRTHEDQADMLQERPGFAAALDHSPHQAGIAVDVDLTQEGDPLSWLQANAADYHFYPLSGAGATKEPWHWEYHG